MYKDIFGKNRIKVNLHTHTTESDGERTPDEVAQIYRDHGYDAIAITDHWNYGEEHICDNGLLVLSGVEYNIYNVSSKDGLFHIVGVGMEHEPEIDKSASAQDAINAIRAAGGLAVIAHPAWSLNTPAHIMALEGGEATEIYNSISGVHMSRRPDSSLIVDMLGAIGRFYPLLATDDAHHYDNDHCYSWIMAEAEECSREAILSAVREQRFYATQGPEIHMWREGDEFVVRCSPCKEIVFFSDMVWTPRVFVGEGITEARYTPRSAETFIRAEVMDENGKRAWTNCVVL